MPLKPRITAWVGPMYSEKTEEAKRQWRVATAIPGLEVVYLKPKLDTRYGDPRIVRSHADPDDFDPKIPVTLVEKAGDVWEVGKQADVLILDEGQMLPPSIARVLLRLYMERGVRVNYFGLDLTWQGRYWATTSEVITLPETKVFKEKGLCALCHGNSRWSQKLRNGIPVHIFDPQATTFEVGEQELYRALCWDCWFKTTPGAQQALDQGLIGSVDPETYWGEPPK
ncbi:MAG: hypothetical protein HY420_04385 [Candidatus Kerfeldbacteria bacterium]|nr:hypothetical protein [Candidatus Kerfeldbacteria bacterium]